MPGPQIIIVNNQQAGGYQAQPQPQPQVIQNFTGQKSPCSAAVALALCLLVGLLGVHRFYTGHIITGIALLLLTITGYGIYINIFWLLVDCILIATSNFKDSQGRTLSFK
jgi:TM2 domain-containing membrane protein YozV